MTLSIQFNDKHVLFSEDNQTSATLYAAGSLRAALSEVSQAFTKEYKIPVKLEFDHSGLLRERLEKGEITCDIFASADVKNPTALMKATSF